MANGELFRADIAISRIFPASALVTLDDVVVDPSVMFAWIPAKLLVSAGVLPEDSMEFVTADGRHFERSIGFGFVHAAGESAPTLLIFAEAGDRTLIGAHALSGMNLKVDPVKERLVPAGPISAAAA